MNGLLQDKHVLWVDDHHDEVRIERDGLEAAGAKLTLADTPGSAFAKLRAREFDLVILDIMCDGEVSQGIKNIKTEIGMKHDGRHNGVPLAIWMLRNKPALPFFFYSVIAHSDDEVGGVFDEMELLRTRMEEKRVISGSEFAQLAARYLGT